MPKKLTTVCQPISNDLNENNPFKGGNMIRHVATLDIDIAILNVQYETEEYIKLKILYCNRNNSTLFSEKPYIVRINNADKDKWQCVGKHSY